MNGAGRRLVSDMVSAMAPLVRHLTTLAAVDLRLGDSRLVQSAGSSGAAGAGDVAGASASASGALAGDLGEDGAGEGGKSPPPSSPPSRKRFIARASGSGILSLHLLCRRPRAGLHGVLSQQTLSNRRARVLVWRPRRVRAKSCQNYVRNLSDPPHFTFRVPRSQQGKRIAADVAGHCSGGR